MADWWVQDTADPAHPELRAGQQSGWWGQDAADPGFPATAMPKPEKSQAAGETLDAGSLPIFEPNSGLLVANDMQKDMGPMRAFGGLAAGAASPVVGAAQLAAHGAQAVAPESMTPLAKFTDDANAWLSAKGSTPEYDIGR